MKKPVKANIKFKDYSPGQTLLLPPSLDDLIDANHPVRIVDRVIDQVGMSQPDHNTLNRFGTDRDQHNDLRKNPFSQEKLYYNEQKDCYYCPMGQPMRRIGNRKTTGSDGYTQMYARYQAINCQGCPLRGMCHDRSDNLIIKRKTPITA